MKLLKIKSQKYIVQNWLLKLAILCSVFAFTGYNNAILEISLESDHIELIEDRSPTSGDILINLVNHITQTTPITNSIGIEDTSYKYALSVLNKAVGVKYITIRKNLFTYDFTSLKLPLTELSLSSDDDYAFIL